MRITSTLALAALVSALAGCADTHYQPLELNGQVSLSQPLKPGTARDTQVRVRLLNTDGLAAGLLAEETLDNPPRFPAAFVLRVDRLALRATAHYQLDAQVYSGGELKMQGSTPLTLPENATPSSLAVEARPLLH